MAMSSYVLPEFCVGVFSTEGCYSHLPPESSGPVISCNSHTKSSFTHVRTQKEGVGGHCWGCRLEVKICIECMLKVLGLIPRTGKNKRYNSIYIWLTA